MFGLGWAAFIGGFVLIYAGVKALDPRCLIQRVFDPSVDCQRIDAGDAPVSSVAGASPAPPGFSENTAVNAAKAMKVYVQVKARFPGVSFGGITSCRKQRGSTGDPNRWSVHSVGGAVDVWPHGESVNAIIQYAKSIPGVWGAWLDSSPGDVHIQVIPNPPSNWVPPCAGGAR